VLKGIFKVTVVCVLLLATYKVAQGYFTYRWATYVAECAGTLELCNLGKQKASDQVVSAAVDKLYSCVRTRQPFLESLLVPLPKSHAAISSDPVDYKYAEDFCRVK
jgi:hypothetical protein